MAVSVVVFIKERFVRELLVNELGNNADMEVLFSRGDIRSAPEVIDYYAPRVVVVDVNLERSLPTIQAILARKPETVIVATGVSVTEKDVVPCARAGVRGYIHNDVSISECAEIIRLAMRGEVHSTRIAGLLNRYLHDQFSQLGTTATSRAEAIQLLTRAEPRTPSNNVLLTSREQQVMSFVDQGLSNKEIARELGVEVSTVKNHMHNILKKFKVKRRMEAAACFRAIETGTFARRMHNA